jgi:hypothetical protein
LRQASQREAGERQIRPPLLLNKIAISLVQFGIEALPVNLEGYA